MLSEGYDELCADKFARGSGTAEPMGVLTALAATAGSQVTPTTDGAFGQEDIYKVWKGLPEKYRSRASWVMSVDVNNRIRPVRHRHRTLARNDCAAASRRGRPADEEPGLHVQLLPTSPAPQAGANILAVGDFGATA